MRLQALLLLLLMEATVIYAHEGRLLLHIDELNEAFLMGLTSADAILPLIDDRADPGAEVWLVNLLRF